MTGSGRARSAPLRRNVSMRLKSIATSRRRIWACDGYGVFGADNGCQEPSNAHVTRLEMALLITARSPMRVRCACARGGPRFLGENENPAQFYLFVAC
jgi:hypothetical protein